MAAVSHPPPFRSSNLQAYLYNKEEKILTVTFQSGARYAYQEVPESIYLGMIRAPSKGQYLAAYVKGRFRFTRLPEEGQEAHG